MHIIRVHCTYDIIIIHMQYIRSIEYFSGIHTRTELYQLQSDINIKRHILRMLCTPVIICIMNRTQACKRCSNI